MQNKGTDYIRRILRDKARQKTLETNNAVPFLYSCFLYNICTDSSGDYAGKKTTCEEEEQIAIQEEQTPIQETNENTVQSTIPSDDSEDIEFVSCEPIEEETDDV